MPALSFARLFPILAVAKGFPIEAAAETPRHPLLKRFVPRLWSSIVEQRMPTVAILSISFAHCTAVANRYTDNIFTFQSK